MDVQVGNILDGGVIDNGAAAVCTGGSYGCADPLELGEQRPGQLRQQVS
jgi:hypothetical protein